MDIREPHSFIALFFASFQLINRAFGALFGFALAAIIGYGLIVALTFTPVPQFVTALLLAFYSIFLTVVFFKLLAAKAEEDNLSLPDLSASSLLPTIYMIILFLLLGFIALCVGFVQRVIGTDPSLPVRIVMGVVSFIFYVGTFFAPLVVAVREQNPIAALVYGFQLSKRHVFYVIATLILMALTPTVIMGAIGYGLYVTIPLYFADSFNLLQPSAPWIGVGVVLVLIALFIQLAMAAYYVLVFLNLDYRDNRLATPELPQAQITPQPGQVLPPGAGPAAQTYQDMQVTKASVKSNATEDLLDQHLDQVYQPKKEDMVQYTEEDRMPTILFDDDMAQQMELNRQKWEQEKAKSHNRGNADHNEGDSPIKISK